MFFNASVWTEGTDILQKNLPISYILNLFSTKPQHKVYTMNVTRSSSNAPLTPIGSSPQDDSYLSGRVKKIVLAIFASLVGFVFLPFKMALILTAVVTIGAVMCCTENNTPPATLPATPIDPETERTQQAATLPATPIDPETERTQQVDKMFADMRKKIRAASALIS
jgi:hypothetical protein